MCPASYGTKMANSDKVGLIGESVPERLHLAWEIGRVFTWGHIFFFLFSLVFVLFCFSALFFPGLNGPSPSDLPFKKQYGPVAVLGSTVSA